MKAFKTSRTPSLCAKRKATLGNAQQFGSSNFLQRDAQFYHFTLQWEPLTSP
jgi:hypothetical protein